MLKSLLLDDAVPGTPDGVTPLFVEVGAAPTAANAAAYPPGSIARFGTAYYINIGSLTAPSWVQISTLVSQTDVALTGARAIYTRLGLAMSGLANDASLGDLWDDFDKAASASVIPGWFRSNAGTGATATQVAGSAAGLVQFSTGVGANSREDWHALVGAIANVSTSRWYVAARLKVATAADAQAIVGFGLVNLAFTKTIIAGIAGGLDVAHFTVQYDGNFGAGSSLSLVTAPDTNIHVVELAGRADGKVYARLDGGTIVSATMAAAPADSMYPIFTTRNGAAGNVATQQVDWALGLFARI